MYDWSRYRYLSLGTRRRSGVFVDTPVWFAPVDDRLYVFSNADAGKVKRLRNDAQVRLTPCTVSGRPLGEPSTGRARLLQSESEIARAHDALRQRYGWQMRLLDWGARLAGRDRRRAWIEVEPVPPAA